MKMMDAYKEGMVAGAIITVENLREKHLISDKVADAFIKAAKEFHFSSREGESWYSYGTPIGKNESYY